MTEGSADAPQRRLLPTWGKPIFWMRGAPKGWPPCAQGLLSQHECGVKRPVLVPGLMGCSVSEAASEKFRSSGGGSERMESGSAIGVKEIGRVLQKGQ